MTTAQAPRVLYAAPLFYPIYGGAQLRFLRYMPGLRARGIDTAVFSGTPRPDDLDSNADIGAWRHLRTGVALPDRVVNGSAIRRVRLPTSKGLWRNVVYYHSLYRFCRSPDGRPDILNFVTNLRPKALPWIWRLRRAGIACVYSRTTTQQSGKEWDATPARLRAYRRLLNNLDGIVVASEALRSRISALGVTTDIRVIPNGVDTELFDAALDADERSRAKQALPGVGPDDPVVLFVGNVGARKGADLLLDAWRAVESRHPRAHLVFAGPGGNPAGPGADSFDTRLRKLMADMARPDRVHFLGPVDNVATLYRGADVVALASDREGMPNSVLEGMASGCAVVMTPFPSLSDELGTAGEHYLLADRNPAGLAAALDRLLSDPDFRDRLARSGRLWVREHLALDMALDRYAEFYRQTATTEHSNPGAVSAVYRPRDSSPSNRDDAT